MPADKLATEYMAAERTFLAWIRTSIAIITLGFVIAKFGVWLREIAIRLDPNIQIHSIGMSLPMGETMMAFGGILSILAAWHYHIVNMAIERGEVRPSRGLVFIVTFAVVALSALMITYMQLASTKI
ncbi:MAG TPA: DUF202 domain-containing protein [Burkholderiales bacterium]|nr:DUF202 domain-containing protein [Pseudomonadota bacterium]HVC49773.1 DUF202 domain-containing protein [Burkholderiales bacterium]